MRNYAVLYTLAAALPLYVACAASDETTPAGGAGQNAGATVSVAGTPGAGTPGTGGAPTAGTPATGGTPTAGTPGGGTPGGGTPAGGTPAGGMGTGGSAPMGDCAAPTATAGLISDFANDMNVAAQQTTGTDVWTASPAGMNTLMVTAGAAKVTQSAGTWGSVSAFVNKGATCLNMTGKYTGIKFKISSATNTQIKFVLVVPETKTDSSHYGKIVPVTSTATEVSIPFAMLEKATWGAGMALAADYKPEAHVAGLGFGVTMEAEKMDITLDDVSFM